MIRADRDQLDELAPLFAGYLDFYQRPADPATVRAFLDARLQRGDSTIFLARDEGRALGFVQLYPAFASLSMRPNWILNDLYVDPSARGRGIGRALMAAARDLAERSGACELFLQTARDNAPAQALYRDLGYVRDDHFLVYTLSLPAP